MNIPARISIVEDLEEVREFLHELILHTPNLEPAGVFCNGQEALSGISTDNTDVIIMDIGLPDMSGTEAMLRLKTAYSALDFMMFTIFEDDDNLFEALKAGASGYILKRDPGEKIVRAIFEILEGGAPMSAVIAKKVMESFRKPTPGTPLAALSERENEVLAALAQGLLYKEVAEKLYISEGTVKQHVNHIYGKLQVQNRTEAINRYLRRG
ncbi:MAG: response regulator transcription factor [Chitinophagales bacterium]|nr:response regulator transcription factor [Chitinophagales bacterium]